MMRTSAGLVMYRRHHGLLQVLLVHPGGPFWRNKDTGAWTIPKGEAIASEDLLATAKREFHEETGIKPIGPFIQLNPIKQKAGKTVHAWAFEGNCDPSKIISNTFTMEWPPRSGQKIEFPEIDRADFFDLATAKLKINPAQVPYLEQVSSLLNSSEKRRSINPNA